jgi:hypothetical protein
MAAVTIGEGKGYALHGCAYPGCAKEVATTKLACLMHWFCLPEAVSDLLYREYLTGRLDVPGFAQRHRHQAIRELALAWWVLDAKLDDGVEKHREHMERAKFQRRRSIAAGQGDPFAGLSPSDVFEDAEALAVP